MTEIKRVKIQNIIESQIPEFLNEESPLFREFLTQYYISQEHQTGLSDLAVNIEKYKGLDSFNNETFYTSSIPSILSEDLLAFSSEIKVSHTISFPEKYGLIKIGNEIITYTSKDDTTFYGCIRGFSGVDSLKKDGNPEEISFSKTSAESHIIDYDILSIERSNSTEEGFYWKISLSTPYNLNVNEKIIILDSLNQQDIPVESTVVSLISNQIIEVLTTVDFSLQKNLLKKTIQVKNLNLIFFDELFRKFKSQFLPGFENRNFISEVNLQNILGRAIDFYTSKGTDTSYRLLFNILYGESISVIKPQDYILKPPIDNYFTTRNILVEKITDGDPFELKGKTLFQDINETTSSASIYSVEYRPVDGKDLFEIYLDSTSFVSEFNSTKKTNLLEPVKSDDTSIIVDSTIGFEKSGNLVINTVNLKNPITITYQRKTINQFLGITGIISDLEINDEVYEEKFVYSYLNNGEIIKFRLINVIGEIDYENTSSLRVGDKINLSSFGIDLSDKPELNCWLYNLPTEHDIKFINQSNDTSGRGWTVTLYDSNRFYVGQSLIFYNTNDINDIPIKCTVRDIISDNIIEVNSTINIKNKNKLEKELIKASSLQNYHSEITPFTIGVQNTYVDEDLNNFYVASLSLPNYEISTREQVIYTSTENGIGKTDTIITDKVHNFYTGELVYYFTPENSGISSGIYHITTIGDIKDSKKIKFSLSKSDLYSKKYVQINSGITSGYFVKTDYQSRKLKSESILKKFSLNKNLEVQIDREDKTTVNRRVGIFVNGVEIYSPTLYDENIYYGKIDSILVTNSGNDYDIINPPEIEIFDTSGANASAYANIVGQVKDVKIISPGIGYKDKPKISIIGGNGSGAVLEPNLVRSRIVSGFRGDGNGVNPSTDVITFSNNHNFEEAEEVIYNSNFNNDINPLRSGSVYYVGLIDEKKIKLYNNKNDAIRKINEINISGISSGFQNFSSFSQKNTINKIYVKNPGSGYSNNKVIIPSILAFDGSSNGVNDFDDYIFAKSHNFKNKDIVRYSYEGSPISGLSTETQYLVTIVDENKFRLSECGLGTFYDENNYNNKNYIDIRSIGSGRHTFYYPPIEIIVESISGTASTTVISPILEPIVLGAINNVHLENAGVGYGVSDIINFHRRPDIRIKQVESEAVLRPIIINGSIVDVQILTFGSGYDPGIDIIVNGDGKFADIRPIIQNGKVVSVNVLDGGKGYDPLKTSLSIVKRGKNAKFIGNIFEWKINQIKKNSSQFTNNDSGFIVPSRFGDSLEYINFYLPKLLRSSIKDHLDDSSREVLDNTHSPIVGWSYDGNPIYGPYGQFGSQIQRIRSSYSLNIESNLLLRPDFDEGFFIQDYKFDRAIGDLDEYNGRFCRTPEFPNGVYAYFSTINSETISKPEYPYVVGPQFKDTIIKENYDGTFNQDIDFSSLNLIRNIGPYYLNSNKSSYKAINSVTEKYKQEFIVKETKGSGVEDIIIYNRGSDYKVGDSIVFVNSGTGGSGLSAFISEVRGKPIDKVEIGITTLRDCVFSIIGSNIKVTTEYPHNLITEDQIVVSSISSSPYSYVIGSKKIFVTQKTVGLTTSIPSVGITGNTTYIYVNDTSGFEVDDFIQIDSEILKILSIDQSLSRFYVNRIDNAGVHTSGLSSVSLLPSSFTFSQENNKFNTSQNKIVYFDPNSTVGFGTSVTNYIQPNQFNLTVQPRSIYIPNHNFFTGQELKYHVGYAGTGITVSKTFSLANPFRLEDGQSVYAINFGKDFIGIASIGFSTVGDALYFFNNTPIAGIAHSLSTTYKNITGIVEKYYIDVETKENHQLNSNDEVEFNINPNLIETVGFRYDQFLRKITTELTNFSPSTDLNIDTSEIYLPNNKFKTGDKVVYYSNGSSSISGLLDNATYYIVKNDVDYVRLAVSYYDSNISNTITLNQIQAGTHSFALINPPISFTKGNKILFDLSDPSLVGMDMKLFYDQKLIKEIESFKYQRSFVESGLTGARLTVNGFSTNLPNEIYYNFIPLSPQEIEKSQVSFDDQVIGRNKITLSNSKVNSKNNILKINSKKFRIGLRQKPESTVYNNSVGISSIYYKTNSPQVTGPISKIKISYGGKSYKKIPKVSEIKTFTGKNAQLKCFSNTIGKIDYLERIKDGFDYPSDVTLKPVLSVPAVCQIKDISRVDYVGITTGGNNYNNPPKLKVIGNDNIKLTAICEGGSVTNVRIDQNTNNLSSPLRVVPIRNSNGYDIDDIVYDNFNKKVTLELVNSDNQLYPLITNQYGGSEVDFPFEIGDEIFIENCRIKTQSTPKTNYNSSDYNYRFFTVTGINTSDFTVTYDVSNLSSTFGEYTTDFNFGYVVNRKNMAEFNMEIIDDLSYVSNELVIGYNNIGIEVFSARVMENGWDNDVNELRLIDVNGELEVGNKLYGTVSKLNGTIEYINKFNLKANLKTFREKINNFNDTVGLLNESQQRISDNDYYQKFSYSIKSKLSYDIWKEPVRSLVHPAGFKEFSDLDVVSIPSNNMNIGINSSSLDLLINIDNTASLYTKNNFSMVTEDELLDDGSIERVFFPEGVALKPYILSKTNKVILIDDISDNFTGYTTSIGGGIVGITTFDLRTKNTPLFYRQFDSSDDVIVKLPNNTFNFNNHNFQSGQKVNYELESALINPVGIVSTVVDEFFNYGPISDNFDSPIVTVDDTSYTFDSN